MWPLLVSTALAVTIPTTQKVEILGISEQGVAWKVWETLEGGAECSYPGLPGAGRGVRLVWTTDDAVQRWTVYAPAESPGECTSQSDATAALNAAKAAWKAGGINLDAPRVSGEQQSKSAFTVDGVTLGTSTDASAETLQRTASWADHLLDSAPGSNPTPAPQLLTVDGRPTLAMLSTKQADHDSSSGPDGLAAVARQGALGAAVFTTKHCARYMGCFDGHEAVRFPWVSDRLAYVAGPPIGPASFHALQVLGASEQGIAVKWVGTLPGNKDCAYAGMEHPDQHVVLGVWDPRSGGLRARWSVYPASAEPRTCAAPEESKATLAEAKAGLAELGIDITSPPPRIAPAADGPTSLSTPGSFMVMGSVEDQRVVVAERTLCTLPPDASVTGWWLVEQEETTTVVAAWTQPQRREGVQIAGLCTL